MDEDRDLLVDRRDDGIIVLTLNRPKARNTVSFEMWDQFNEILSEIEGGTPARGLILTGANGYFSNGGDVKTPPARGDGALKLAARLEMGQRIISRIRSLPVPTIAAIEGGSWGISWSLAMACDLIFAGESVTFGAPFIAYGLVPDGGAAWFLTKRLGRYRAAEIIYSGRALPVAEAFDLGLVSRIVPDGQVLPEALAFAQKIGDGNRHATELAKRLITTSEDSPLSASHALELVYCHVCQGGEEVVRARENFIAKSAARKAEG